jgi:serine/threonine-protein kinase RsbW/stage II sporulation protein AB (anti-sigma F factor)
VRQAPEGRCEANSCGERSSGGDVGGDHRLTLALPAVPASVPEARGAVFAWCQQLGVTPRRRAEICLALTEACANVVQHAYRPPSGAPGALEIEAVPDRSEVVLTVRDYGLGLRPRPDSPGAGLGLPLMAALCDRVEVRRTEEPPTTELVLRFAL